MPWGFAAAAAGTVASAAIGSNASTTAANTEAKSAQAATNAELSMFDTLQGDLAPYQAGGTNALTSLQKVLGIGSGGGGATNPILQMLGYGANGQPTGGGINPATFQTSPGYQFQMQQGTNAVTNSAAASGGLGGNALKSLTSYGSGLANNGWQQYLSNLNGGYQGLVGNLRSLVGTGESAAAGVGSGALTTGKQIGSNLIGAGNATGNGQIGSANALAGGLGGAGQNGLLAMLLNQSGGGGGGLFGSVGSGISNLFNGYSYGGIPSSNVLDGLSTQAANNTAAGAPGM